MGPTEKMTPPRRAPGDRPDAQAPPPSPGTPNDTRPRRGWTPAQQAAARWAGKAGALAGRARVAAGPLAARVRRNPALAGLIGLASLLVLLFLTGTLHLGAADHAAGGEGEHEEASRIVDGKVVLELEAVQAAGFRIVPATVGGVSSGLQVPGEVQSAVERTAHVTPRIRGVVRAIYADINNDVAAGTPLATIESAELGEARAEYAAAVAERTLAERNYGRWRQLYERGLRTQNELWVAESELTRARLRADAAHAKLRAFGLANYEIAALARSGPGSAGNLYAVRSAVSGTVLARDLTVGENVEPQDKIFLVADLDSVWVQAAVSERDLPLVRVGLAATVRLQNFPDAAYPGRVTSVGQQANPQTRAVPIRIEVRNRPLPGSTEPHALHPGAFATVEIETARTEGSVVVPLAAVQSMGAQSVVFVEVPVPPAALAAHGDEKHEGKEKETGAPRLVAFERRAVTLGARNARVVEVLSGLNAGERIVVENAYLLKSEFEKSKIADEH